MMTAIRTPTLSILLGLLVLFNSYAYRLTTKRHSGISSRFTAQTFVRYASKTELFNLPKPDFEGYDVPSTAQEQFDRDSETVDEADYVVIGSGIGGLSCAALLRWYGYSVIVLESHYLAGGVAHAFERKGFKFDAGPSLWNGMSTKPYNPLREVLEIVGAGDKVRYAKYDGWVMHVPEGSFKFTVGEGQFEPIIRQFGGNNALNEWKTLLEKLKPVQELATAIPPLTLRSDLGVLLTLRPHLTSLLKGLPHVGAVEGSFRSFADRYVKDEFLVHWFDFLSFALSGLPADGTLAAAVAYTMRDLHQNRAMLDYPIGGGEAIVDALVGSITGRFDASASAADTILRKPVGKVLLGSHVSSIVVENGRAVGVELRRRDRQTNRRKQIKARRAVISNASVWDTARLLPEGAQSATSKEKKLATPMTGSFVHLYLGINATGLPANLESHYSVINRWDPIDAPQNHVIISIPSVLDPALAPEGCHTIHAYAAANEPYELYENNTSKEAYEQLKTERCEFLWQAIERSIPDVRDRVIVALPASPITHERFNRRYKGTFGPALRAGVEKFPSPVTDVPGLFVCGDSVFPGIGVPAVAASGAYAASCTVSVWQQLEMLDTLYAVTKSD